MKQDNETVSHTGTEPTGATWVMRRSYSLREGLVRLAVADELGEAIAIYCANARRLGHGSHLLAAAAYLTGYTAYSLCCGCAESVEGKAIRLPAGGECDRCSYVGVDCLVIVPDDLKR
jgi:hypothetical protein